MLVEWDEMKQLYRGPYIDALCQVWFHLAQLFQRSTLKYEKVNRRTPSDGNATHGSGVPIKKGALDSQPKVIKLTSWLPMVGGSLRLPPPLKLVAMI